MSQTRSRSRSAARLAAVQALYQQEMEGTPLPRLLKEFHDHRLGATIEDAHYHDAERDFFDDIVTGADARRAEIDGLISARLAEGWSLERLDRPMRAILRAGAYELIARADVPVGSVISEYVDVAHAFYDKRESGFVNGLLDAIAKEARPARLKTCAKPKSSRDCAGSRPRPKRAACSTMSRCSTASSSPTTASPRASISCPPIRPRASAGSSSRSTSPTSPQRARRPRGSSAVADAFPGDGEWETRFLGGVEAACESYGLPLIGGDTIALPPARRACSA